MGADMECSVVFVEKFTKILAGKLSAHLSKNLV